MDAIPIDHEDNNRDGIYLRNVCFSYSSQAENVLNGIDLSASRGEIYGLLGPSGCGKSTLIRSILGLQRTDFGDVKLFNHPPSRKCIGIPGPNVGFMPQEIALYELLTVNETLVYFGNIFGLKSDLLLKRMVDLGKLLLLNDWNQEIGTMSGGQQRRVSFAVSVLHQPPLIVLDEPTAGVDPLLRQRLWNYLIELCSSKKCTILITTHYIEEARRANRIGFMRKGRILCEGAPDVLMQRYAVTSLEQVFLKLCDRKRKSTIASASELVHFKQAYQREKLINSTLQVPRTRSHSVNADKVQAEVQVESTSGLNVANHCTIVNPNQSAASRLLIWWQIVFTLFIKNFMQELRNPLQLSLQFASPVAQVLLFALCVGRAPFHIPIGVHLQEFSFLNLSNKLMDCMQSPSVRLIPYHNYTHALGHVHQGRLWAVMSVPRLFSHAFIERQAYNVSNQTIRNSRITVRADLSNRIISDLTLNALNQGYERFVHKQLHEYSLESRFSDTYIAYKKPIFGIESCENRCSQLPYLTAQSIAGRIRYNRTAMIDCYDKCSDANTFEYVGQRNYMVPGIIINLGFAISIALSSLPLIDERGKQTLERHYAFGVTSGQMMFAHALCRLALHIPYAIFMLILPNLLFNIPLVGSLWVAILMLLLQAACGSSLGVLLAGLSKSLLMAMVGTSGAFIICLFGSGTLWPLESVPIFIRPIVLLLPTTLSTQGLRNIMLKGWGLVQFQVWSAFVLLSVWSVLLFLVGIQTFKMTNH